MSASTSADKTSPYFVVDSPHEVANWRPLVHWLLYIPHGIILYGLQILARAVFLVYWLIAVFTGKLNRGLYDLLTMFERYNARASGFLVGYSETYPPFDFRAGPDDNDAYPPMRLTLPTPPQTVARSAALNVILAVPHYIMVIIYGIGSAVVAIIGWFAVLFTGAWPANMRAFLIRVSNYYYRVWSYVTMVETDYPSFALPER